MSLSINELFHSIQGESLYNGLPCVLVRFSGCNLRCAYCDTRYAYEEGVAMDIPEILEQVAIFKCPLVAITGGEPLLQPEMPWLVSNLLNKGYEVILETNGSLDISIIDGRCVKIVDVKCPSSNESDKNDLDNLKRLSPKDQLKFVIGDRKDYEYARKILKLRSQGFPLSHILFSPVSGKIAPARLAQWILEDNLRVRLHLQMHKIIWPDRQRGV